MSDNEVTVSTEYVVCYADLRGKGWPRVEVKRFRLIDDENAESNAQKYADAFDRRAKAFVVKQVITVTESRL